jgi:DNA polymerase-3 subunit beta
VFAAARDDSRPVLAAVLFDFNAEGLILAAADGFRLAKAELAHGAGTFQQLLVPARAVSEFGRLLGDVAAARLAPTADGRGLYLFARQTTLFSRLIDGRFPDIERVIPRDWQTRVTVSTPALRQAVRVAALFGGGDARPVVLRAADGRLELRASGDETGEAESELTASVEGERQAVALNTRLLIELLDAVRDPDLELCWTTPTTPVLLREHGRREGGDIWILMPLHDARLLRHDNEKKAA